MATRYPRPKEIAVESLLSGIVSIPAHVARTQAASPEGDAVGLFAEFTTESDEVAVLAFADHDIVNYVGGALAAVEVEAAQAASEQVTLNGSSVERFREVVESFTAVLNSEYTPELKLANVEQVPAQLSEDARHLWGKPPGKRAYRITVDDYGAGVLQLFFA